MMTHNMIAFCRTRPEAIALRRQLRQQGITATFCRSKYYGGYDVNWIWKIKTLMDLSE